MENVAEEKDLGVTNDTKLSFGSHIFAKVKKASSVIAIFKKTFVRMTRPVFLNIYKGLIRPHLVHCIQVWHLLLKKHVTLIGNVHRRAIQMVIGLQDLSYNERLQKLDLTFLEYLRRRRTMIEMFKSGYNHYDPKATKEIFDLSKRDTRTNYSEVFLKKASVEVRKHFFTIRAATD